MDAKIKAEQDIISAADCWAREVLQSDRILNTNEQNLLNAVMVLDRIIKSGIELSHLPPPPNVPHDMDIDIEEQIPTVRYSERITIPSENKQLDFFNNDLDDIL
jgi:hypothetical protein